MDEAIKGWIDSHTDRVNRWGNIKNY